MSGPYAVDVVRGRLTEATAAEILAFWSARGALPEPEARRRLPEVLCVVRDADARVAGVSSAFVADVPLVGRPFWIYRRLVAPEALGAADALFRAGWAVLDAESVPGQGPIGLCQLIRDPAEMRRRPEVEWADPRTIYVGYGDDGAQVRVAYFIDATFGPGEDDG